MSRIENIPAALAQGLAMTAVQSGGIGMAAPPFRSGL
jgi:hypothetical protein